MRWTVVLRNAAGREETMVIHDKPSANAASNKAVREASGRFGHGRSGRWYVVSCDPHTPRRACPCGGDPCQWCA
jgi:hypothetical protein